MRIILLSLLYIEFIRNTFVNVALEWLFSLILLEFKVAGFFIYVLLGMWGVD